MYLLLILWMLWNVHKKEQHHLLFRVSQSLIFLRMETSLHVCYFSDWHITVRIGTDLTTRKHTCVSFLKVCVISCVSLCKTLSVIVLCGAGSSCVQHWVIGRFSSFELRTESVPLLLSPGTGLCVPSFVQVKNYSVLFSVSPLSP